MLEYALDMVDWSTPILPRFPGILGSIKRYTMRRWRRGINRQVDGCYVEEDFEALLWWISSY